MIILSGVVIVSLSKNNPVEKAKLARKLTAISEVRNSLSAFATNILAGIEKDITFDDLKDPTDKTGVLINDDMYYTLSPDLDDRFGIPTNSPIDGDENNEFGYYAVNEVGSVMFVVTNKVAAKELGIDLEESPNLNHTVAAEGVYVDID